MSPVGFTMPEALNPAETAVLFVDFQKRWTEDRDTRVLAVIERFADRTAALGTHNYWIAHEIGLAHNYPQTLTETVAADLDGLPEDDRFVVDLKRRQGYVVGKTEPGAFTNHHVLEHMQWSGVKRVFGCGYIAGQCVVSTLIGARSAGFAVGLIADLSVDNLPNGMLCSRARRTIRTHRMPRVRSGPLLQALNAGSCQP